VIDTPSAGTFGIADQASVADGLVLPSGRILIYFVIGAKIVNGTQQPANDIVVAVSDSKGISLQRRRFFGCSPEGHQARRSQCCADG
jgi:hypothetical protein